MTEKIHSIAISTDALLMGTNFRHNGKTYRANLGRADEKGLFVARLTRGGREMIGEEVVFRQTTGA